MGAAAFERIPIRHHSLRAEFSVQSRDNRIANAWPDLYRWPKPNFRDSGRCLVKNPSLHSPVAQAGLDPSRAGLVLVALGESDITEETIAKLSGVAALLEELKKPLNQFATFWGRIDTYGPKSL